MYTRIGLASFALVASLVFGGEQCLWGAEAGPTHKEGAPLCGDGETKVQRLHAFCLDRNGNLLVCDTATKAIKVVSPDDKLVATWQLNKAPTAVTPGPGDHVFVGGAGQLARLDKDGKTLKNAAVGTGKEPVAALAASDSDVFVAVQLTGGFTVFRMNHDLEGPKKIVEGLRGCCGQMDITWHDGVLYAAENARKRVVYYDREGKLLGSFAKDDRKAHDYFGGCCNPKNLCIGPGGEIYAAESDLGRVRRYRKDGTLVALVGTVKAPPGCVRITVAVNADATRVYLLDGDKNVIRVLEGPAPQVEEAASAP